MKKNIIAITLMLVLLFVFSACDSSKSGSEEKDSAPDDSIEVTFEKVFSVMIPDGFELKKDEQNIYTDSNDTVITIKQVTDLDSSLKLEKQYDAYVTSVFRGGNYAANEDWKNDHVKGRMFSGANSDNTLLVGVIFTLNDNMYSIIVENYAQDLEDEGEVGLDAIFKTIKPL